MIGYKVMTTLASVKIEIVSILGLSYYLSTSSVRCLENADEAQISRVPVPLLEDPYEAVRHAYLDRMNTESEPFEAHELPLTIASSIPLFKSTPPVLVPVLRRTACMAVCVPSAMSPGFSTSIAEVAAMSDSAFRKRFGSSYESSPSVSPPDLPLRKRYRGTSELVEDSEEDGDDLDENIEESMDSDSVSEDAKDEGSTTKDDDLAIEDDDLAAWDEDDEGHSIESDGLGLEEEEEEVVPGGQQQAAPVVGIAVSAPLGLGYGALRPKTPSIVPSSISSPMIPLTVPSPVATPAIAETEGFLTELGAQVEMQGD
uniref:Uncharacterized protein n=1 Tax=Tanacetum cinerariifolium TaxID=118510 RepID=A0A6L2K6W1_TANCI|nr:hypothetical protein [Tanacetum cinerariifolium]